jgi:hypothetical protein
MAGMGEIIIVIWGYIKNINKIKVINVIFDSLLEWHANCTAIVVDLIIQ